MKKNLLAMITAALLVAPMAANAIPFQIALTQDGVGDAGADWFGTFEASDTGIAVTSFSAVVNGITYSHLWPILSPVYYGADPLFTNLLNGMAAPIAFQSGDISATVLQFDARNAGGVPVGHWGLSPCMSSSAGYQCGGGRFQGTYSITPVGVPEPGTLALIGLGIVGLSLARRRRATS